MSATWKIGASSSLLMAMIVFGILHAGEVLDRAGNADRDIDFGGDDLAGLADLVIVRRIAGIDRGAAGADRGTELVGKRVEQGMELIGRAEGAAARDDHLGAGQLGAFAFGCVERDEAAGARIAGRIDLFDRARSAFRSRFLERGGADGDDLLRIVRLDGRDRVTGVNRARERVRPLDREDVGDLHHVEQRRDARGDVLSGGCRRDDECVVALHQPGGDRRDRFGELVLERRRARGIDLGDTRDLRRGLSDRVRHCCRRPAHALRQALTRRSRSRASRP